MKKRISILCLLCLTLALFAGCGQTAPAQETADIPAPGSENAASAAEGAGVADAADMAAPVELDLEGLTPIGAESLNEGVYPIEVGCSSSMFRIVSCELTVADGTMTAMMTMGGTGYLYVYPGTGEEASAADSGAYIPFVEDADGAHTFTIPVEALDAPIDCAAFSKNKEMWYDRTLVFSSASLPLEAFAERPFTDPASLGLADGQYTVEVTLEGGSGRASVTSPAELTVSGDSFAVLLEWSSSNYDYMLVDGVEYLPVNDEGNSVFEIPVSYFDYPMPVQADTTAMSQPYLIDYTLTFDAGSVAPYEE